MSHITHVELRQHLPPGVKRIIAFGGGCWIGEVDETTVLKYPHTDEEMKRVRIEAKILEVLGSHSRIVQSKGLTKDGLLLEFAPKGDIQEYFTANPDVPLEQRLSWCVQAAEAVAYIHSKRVLHCDIRHHNLLLDAALDLRLADFQGQHFSPAGEVLLDALSLESTKAYLPRKPIDHASVRTDLFALGSALHFLVAGSEVFPDLHHAADEDEIQRRFREGAFPNDPHVAAAVTAKCWRQRYASARDVLADLEALWDVVRRGERPESLGLVVSASDADAPPPAATWLSGICEGDQLPDAPPPYRQLVGFD